MPAAPTLSSEPVLRWYEATTAQVIVSGSVPVWDALRFKPHLLAKVQLGVLYQLSPFVMFGFDEARELLGVG